MKCDGEPNEGQEGGRVVWEGASDGRTGTGHGQDSVTSGLLTPCATSPGLHGACDPAGAEGVPCMSVLPRPLGSGLRSCPGRGIQLGCSFSVGSLPLFPLLKCKHSPPHHLTEARSPRQAGSSLWGLRLGHIQP